MAPRSQQAQTPRAQHRDGVPLAVNLCAVLTAATQAQHRGPCLPVGGPRGGHRRQGWTRVGPSDLDTGSGLCPPSWATSSHTCLGSPGVPDMEPLWARRVGVSAGCRLPPHARADRQRPQGSSQGGCPGDASQPSGGGSVTAPLCAPSAWTRPLRHVGAQAASVRTPSLLFFPLRCSLQGKLFPPVPQVKREVVGTSEAFPEVSAFALCPSWLQWLWGTAPSGRGPLAPRVAGLGPCMQLRGEGSGADGRTGTTATQPPSLQMSTHLGPGGKPQNTWHRREAGLRDQDCSLLGISGCSLNHRGDRYPLIFLNKAPFTGSRGM